MHLVVVESPAKCKKIGSFLGPSYKVVATMGHIRALEEDIDAVGLDRDFEPRFTFMKEKAKALTALKEAAAGAETIYLAADDDREGEAIAYSVAVFLRKDPLTLPRIVFHEITEKAIKAAVASPRRIDMNKVNAQQTRAILDMMVGFTISPLLWKFIAPKLSAGRCQTPALRLVCDRETAITAHTARSSWVLKGSMKLGPRGAQGEKGTFLFPAEMKDDLDDEESAMNYLENVHTDSGAVVRKNTVSPWTSNPAPPLITSTLQQEASALHHCNPKQTMKLAQELYEAGHITYMRTDSTAISEEAVTEGRAWIEKEHGKEYLATVPTVAAVPTGEGMALAKEKKKKAARTKETAAPPEAQEAHECIRPTHMDVSELTQGTWTPQHKSIYRLIWRRALQSLMAPARGERRVVEMVLKEDTDEFPWSAQWMRTVFAGWHILGANARLDEESTEESEDGAVGERNGAAAWKAADALQPRTEIEWTQITATPKYTKPSPRFTEATLVRELEQKGIGRPSTFASLVETLLDKQYVEKKDIAGTTAQMTTLTLAPAQWPPVSTTKPQKVGAEKGKLVPTALGQQAMGFCVREFPQLFAYSFTAEMEADLDSVSRGECAWKEICRKTWGSYKEHYQQLKATKPSVLQEGKQKDFGGGLKAIMTKKGPLIVQEGQSTADTPDGETTFYSWPEGVAFEGVSEETVRNAVAAQATARVQFGSYKEKAIVKKKGPYGEYVECGALKVPITAEDTRESVLSKLAAREATLGDEVRVGQYVFKKGQYGPYMYKAALKQKVFVKVPATVDVKKLNAADADALYKSGMEAAKARNQWKRGAGGARGRGGDQKTNE